MKLGNYVRDVETGDPFTTGNTEILGPDGSTIASVALDAVTGLWEYSENGNPGKTTAVYSGAGQTRKIAGDVSVQLGDWFLGELSEMFQFLYDGAFPNNAPALSAPGGMNVRVGPGMMLIKGVLLPIYSNEDLAVTAAHASLARIDAVVGRLTRTGTFAGKTELAVVAGTPHATPSAPTLTQTADTWEVKLGEVSVAAAATSISSGNVGETGRRYTGVPGRRMMAKRSFSAVSAISLDECFGSEHRNYELEINVDAATALSNLRLGMRAARANDTNGHHHTTEYTYWSPSTWSIFREGAVSGFFIAETFNTANYNMHGVVRVANPQVAKYTRAWWETEFLFTSGGTARYMGAGGIDNGASYDGFRLFADSGTITGELIVWATDDA